MSEAEEEESTPYLPVEKIQHSRMTNYTFVNDPRLRVIYTVSNISPRQPVPKPAPQTLRVVDDEFARAAEEQYRRENTGRSFLAYAVSAVWDSIPRLQKNPQDVQHQCDELEKALRVARKFGVPTAKNADAIEGEGEAADD